MSSNIHAAPAYGVYISQFIRFFRACASYQDFIDRVAADKKASEPRVSQGKIGRHHDLVDLYEISISPMSFFSFC